MTGEPKEGDTDTDREGEDSAPKASGEQTTDSSLRRHLSLHHITTVVHGRAVLGKMLPRYNARDCVWRVKTICVVLNTLHCAK